MTFLCNGDPVYLEVFDVESRVAFVSPAICRGFDPTQPEQPVLLPNVSAHALTGILEYCRFHTAPGEILRDIIAVHHNSISYRFIF